MATAGNLREEIDDHLDGNGCDSALECPALNIQGVSNSLLTGGLPVSLDINKAIHDSPIWNYYSYNGHSSHYYGNPVSAPTDWQFYHGRSRSCSTWQPLLMRGGSVNVNVFTAMIGTIVFGIGVDDSIHIIDRIKDEGETPSGIVNTVSKTGKNNLRLRQPYMRWTLCWSICSNSGLQRFFILMMLLLVLALLTSSQYYCLAS